MDTSGQHNLSIALRHILQQFMDSSNSGGIGNTDMTLPHDGYIQRLSWHFECDRCCYKTFYCPEMESHKNTCYAYLDNKPIVKKRKMGVPRRTTATVPPPLEDSDPDTQLFPNPHSQQADLMASPSTKLEFPTSTVPMETPPTSNTTVPVSQSVTSPLSVEAPSIEFDAPAASPDYSTPTIPEIEDGSHKALDFDTVPSKETPSVTASVHDPATVSQSETAEAFDPDILEIKVEVEPTAEAEAPPPLSTIDTPTTSSDALFGGAGISDNSVECMMSMFTSSSSQPAPAVPPALHSISNPSPHRFPTNPSLQPPHTPHTPPLLRTPSHRHSFPASVHKSLPHSSSNRPILHPHGNPITPQFSSLPGSATKVYRKNHPLPQLSMGHLSHIKTPARPQHNLSAAPGSAQPSGIKKWTDARIARKILMNPGMFTTLVQIKYSMPCTLRPLLHHKILSVMTMLQARGYGEMRDNVFYKNPILSQTMLEAYMIDAALYRSVLQSSELRYGTTQASSARHNALHRSIFNIEQDTIGFVTTNTSNIDYSLV